MFTHIINTCIFLTQKFRSIQQSERVAAEVSGVDIRNCGAAGNVIDAALAILDLFGGQFGVLVDCRVSPGCVKVQVDAPANNPVADVDVCDLGKSPGHGNCMGEKINCILCQFLSQHTCNILNHLCCL